MNSGKLAFCHSFDFDIYIYSGVQEYETNQRSTIGMAQSRCESISNQLTGLSLIPSDQCCDATQTFTFIDLLPPFLSLANVKVSVMYFILLLHILLICHQDYLQYLANIVESELQIFFSYVCKTVLEFIAF